MSNLSKKLQETLAKIVEATNGPEGLLYVDQKAVQKLIDAGLIEINPDMRDGADNVAARATQKASEPAMNAPVSSAVVAAASAAFAIASVAMPTAKRGGRTGETYPFDKLEKGQSFFVPATEDRPNPAKSLASTVTSANERYSEVIEGQTRQNRKGNIVPATKPVREFAIRSIEDGAPWGHTGVKGAAIFRTL